MDPLQLVTLKPSEPGFMPKNNFQFDIPPALIDPRFRDVAKDLEIILDSEVEKIPVKNITPPDLGKAVDLPKTAIFNSFSPVHKEYANELVKLFISAKNKEDLLAIALYTRDKVNSQLFFYAYSIGLAYRKDTADLALPSLMDTRPDKFISKSVLFDAREEAFVVPPSLRRPIQIPVKFTATDLNPEQSMAYFREDIGVSLHHFHWHIVYPTDGPVRDVYQKDRRGELFFYMHAQILARYNIERMCNRLKVVEPLKFIRAPIKNGYFPKLNSASASRTIIGRQDNVYLQDIERSANMPANRVVDLEIYAGRLRDGILQGFLIDTQGNRVPINNDQGIDMLGNAVESSRLSINRRYYGDIHNTGHVLIANIHDPDNEFMEQPGIMASTNTAMRDPVFYEWHTFIDTFHRLHKSTLPPYTDQELGFRSIIAENITILRDDTEVNELETFWQKSEVNLSTGLDFINSGAIRVAFTHLNHQEFKYRINIRNNGKPRKGTIRIFLLPIFNHAEDEYNLEEGRLLAIEMDRFVVDLKSGPNEINRLSTDSTVTIPFESVFPPIVVNENGIDESFSSRPMNQVHCRCGWPHHLLIPKGTLDGYPCYVFAMVSNHAQDSVVDSTNSSCSESLVFCGIRDSVYPDRRPMGFPFDKPTYYNSLQQFLRPNMTMSEVFIRHVDEVRVEYKAKLVSVETDQGVRVGV